jgi:hypothetical protein
MNRTLDKEHEFYLDETQTGAQMRDQAFKFSNLLAYWTEQLSGLEAQRKTLVAAIEQTKDKAKCSRAMRAVELNYKSAIQDAFIRNYYDEVVSLNGENVTATQLQQNLDKIQEREIEARGNVHVCQTSVDICRSALSYDKQEMSKLIS